jgi:hypothetical protein
MPTFEKNPFRMKKIILLILLLQVNVFYAQEIFKKMENRENFSIEIVDKKMFELMSKVKINTNENEAKNYNEIIKKMEYMKTCKTFIRNNISSMESAFFEFSKTTNFKEIINKTEGYKKIRLLGDETETGTIKEAVMLFVDNENKTMRAEIIYFRGSFNITEWFTLANKVGIPIKSFQKN